MKNSIIFLFLIFYYCHAQQDVVYSQYMYGLSFINPANVANLENINASIFARKQSIGDGYSPFSQSFAIQAPFNNQNMGIGLFVTNETYFIEQKLSIAVAYAYKINISKGVLSFGLAAGVRQMRIDFSNLSKKDDVVLIANNKIIPHFEAGIIYKTKQYYVGLSIKNVASSRFIFDKKNTLSYPFKPHVYLIAAVKHDFSERLSLIPSCLVQYTNGLPVHADLSTHLKFENKFWVGATMRTSASMAMQVGLKLDEYIKQFRQGITVGYAFEYGYGAWFKNFKTSHEIMLLLDFKIHPTVEQIRKKKIIISPLFF